MNQQILDYINQSRQSGMSDDHIRQQLLTSGRLETEVLEAFTILSQIPQAPLSSESFSTPSL